MAIQLKSANPIADVGTSIDRFGLRRKQSPLLRPAAEN
jgi:hypothetical protein